MLRRSPLVSVVLQFAEEHGLALREHALEQDANPLDVGKHAQISAGGQPRSSRLPPIVADFAVVGVFLATDLSQIPCPLMSKLEQDIHLSVAFP